MKRQPDQEVEAMLGDILTWVGFGMTQARFIEDCETLEEAKSAAGTIKPAMEIAKEKARKLFVAFADWSDVEQN